jgi:hypothetical protein
VRWIRFIVLNNGTDRQPTLLLSLYTLIVASPQDVSGFGWYRNEELVWIDNRARPRDRGVERSK